MKEAATRRVLLQGCSIKNFAKSAGKHLHQSLFLFINYVAGRTFIFQ